MHRFTTLARWSLVLVLLSLAPSTLAGCEDEDDPKTWVDKLGNDAKRPGATDRLRRLFLEVMASTHPPNNPRDPAVRRFLDTALPPLTESFVSHPDDNVARASAIEVLAQSQDPRAIPGLIAALSFRPGTADSERVALRAVQALKEMAPQIPEADKPRVTQALIATVDRAQGSSGNPQQIRYNAIQALGALHASSAVDTLVRLLTRPLADQDISTARAAADALGMIGDPRGVDALVYGLYLNIRGQNAFPHCQRALARIGQQYAVPKLIQTLSGQNQLVQGLIAQYANAPSAPPVPDGLVKSTAADVLRAFAAPESTPPLLSALNDRDEPESVRSAAAEALSYIAVAVPPQREQILTALTNVFNENQPSPDHPWSATMIAPRLALIGDPRSIPVLLGALRSHAVADAEHANVRVDLLLPFASIARRANVGAYDEIARGARDQLQGIVQRDAGAEREIRPYLSALDRLDRVISVARDCADGDRACYVGKLGDTNNDVVRKAAYMIAWTTPPADQAAARAAILARINHPDVLVRRSLMVALDRLSPGGCTECVDRLNQLISAEQGQESKILSHLDAQLLISRLHARTAGGGAAAAAR
jgi:HEAT repeat protein